MFLDIKRLFKHTSIYTIGNVINRLAAFILLPLYTHYLTTAEYGALELFYSTAAIISSFLGIGLSHATLRFYFEYKDQRKRNKVIPTTIITSLIISVPPIALLAYFSPFLSEKIFDGEYKIGVLIILVTLLLEISRQIGIAFLRAREHSLLYVLIMFGQFMVQVGCNIYTVAFLKWGVEGILIGNLISVFLSWIVIVSFTLYKCGISYDQGIIKEILKYSYPFLLTSVMGVIFKNTDRFLIKGFISMNALGIYALAFKFGQILQILVIESFQQGFGPFRFSIMKQDNAKDIITRIMHYFAGLILFAGLAISLFSMDIIRVMSPIEYWSAGYLVPIIVLAICIDSVNYIFQTGILFGKETVSLVNINLKSGIIFLILNILLIPILGYYGAAVAQLLTAFPTIMFTYYASQRVFPIKYNFKGMLIPTVIAISFILFSIGLSPNNLNISLTAKGILLIISLIILIKTGFFRKDELDILKSYLNKVSFYLKY